VTTGTLTCEEAGECGETIVRGYVGDCALAGECSSEGDTRAGFIELGTV